MSKLARMKTFAITIIFIGMTLPVSSQNLASGQTVIAETEEQYSRSQTARGEAIAAFRAGDLTVALAGMKHALKDRPTNTAILSNALFLAAETGQTEDAIKFANQFLALGVVPGGPFQAKMQEKLPADVWQSFNERFQNVSQPIGSADTLISVPTDHRLVEGVATDGSGTFFVSTVVSGTILTSGHDQTLSVLVDGADHAAGSFFGIAYSPRERALYVTYGQVDQTPNMPKDEGLTGVMRIDPETGDITGDWSLPGGTDGQQIADIAISPNGTVYVSEAQAGSVYKITDDTLEKLETHKQFRSPQGLAFLGDNNLLMADYGRGLWHINTRTNEANLLALPSSVSLIGIDGLFTHEGRLVAIQNGVNPHRIIEIGLNRALDAVADIKVLAQNLSSFDEPTLGTSTPNGMVFVASSQWPKYAADGVVRDGQTVQPTAIMLLKD